MPKSNNIIKVYEQQNAINKDWTLERYFITNSYYEKMKAFSVYPGDIIVSCAGTIGEVYVLPENAEKGIINQALMIVRTNNHSVNKDYFIYIFEKMIENFSLKFSNGSAIKNIPPFADLKNHIAYIPSLSEQDKIVEFISKIDDRIMLQSKIIEDLILEKKIISDKIFSISPIHKKTLSSFYKKGKAGGTPKSTNKAYYDGDIPFLSISDMTEQGKYLYSTQKKITKEGLDNSTAWVVPEDSLILSMYASVGQVAINKIPLATSQAMFSMTITDKNDLEFLYYYLSYFRENKLHKYLETGTQSNINADFVKNIEIPDYGLKNKQIITLLSLFDEKIQKEKDILSLYKKQKAYLLQNMFI